MKTEEGKKRRRRMEEGIVRKKGRQNVFGLVWVFCVCVGGGGRYFVLFNQTSTLQVLRNAGCASAIEIVRISHQKTVTILCQSYKAKV